MNDLVENLFPGVENPNLIDPPVEEKLVVVPGAILHLIDRQHSVELGSGDFSISLVNSKAGKKFFNLLPGEIVLSGLVGFDVFIWKFKQPRWRMPLKPLGRTFSPRPLQSQRISCPTSMEKRQEN
ncbi:uncharacterized protein LOC144715315 [Wolffia australiana]